jgi:hypothetical protein
MSARLSNTRTRNILALGSVVILAGMLFLPRVASAETAVLTLVGIEGVSGNQADVTPADQLLTTTAQPLNLYSTDNAFVEPSGSTGSAVAAIATSPSGHALVLDHISATVFHLSGPVGESDYSFYVGTSDCKNQVTTENEKYLDVYTPSGTGYTSETDLDPGIPVPEGDSLCLGATTLTSSSKLGVDATATGSVVPPSSVSAGEAQKAVSRPKPR